MNQIKLQDNKLLIPGAKLNFKNFRDVNFDHKDLNTIHLISSTILVSSFKNVCFYNASLLGSKFSKVDFMHCNLKCTDISSIWANECNFLHVDFSEATISDSTFINCTFADSIFESVSLTKCQFIDCTFEHFTNDDSTFALNTFTSCHIIDASFSETFYYQIFDNCILDDVNMEPYLLGFNYGFSPLTFEQLVEGVNLEELHKDLINKKLYSNAAIFHINQVQSFYDEAMVACVAALGQMIQHDILIKADEIEFLKNLTMYFQEHRKIAPISILKIWQLLNDCISNTSPNISLNKAMPHINEYVTMLYSNFINFQEDLQKRLELLPQASSILETVELEVVYSEKPTMPLVDFLTEFCTLASDDCPLPRLIRTERGSFHEFHEVALMVMPYLQTFFALLGVVVPIIIFKKQKNEDNKKPKSKNNTKTNKSEVEITLKTAGGKQSPLLLPNTNIITPTTNTMILDITRIFETQPNISSVEYCGYNTENIQSITIRFQ